MKTNICAKSSGYTLIETTATLAVMAIAGASFFWVLSAMTTESAKNEAVNISHQEVHDSVNRAVQQIHASISIPQLANFDSSGKLTATTSSPAQGVIYQTLISGPGSVAATAAAGQKNVQITLGSTYDPTLGSVAATLPTTNMRLIIPAMNLEDDITAVSGSLPTVTVTLTSNLKSAITISGSPAPVYHVYVTRRGGLALSGSNLVYYPDLSSSAKTVARNVTAADTSNLTKPFKLLGSSNQYIEAGMITSEPKATARGFKYVNVQTTIDVPWRSQIANYQ